MSEHIFEERGLYYRTNTWVPGRPMLVFLHGLSGSSSAWNPHEALFVKTHNILSFDLRGHGKSKKYKDYGAYSMAKFADDLLALVDQLGIDSFILVTHSFGVLIALEFLLHHQDRVSAAVFLSPSFSVRNRLIAKIVRPFLAATHLFKLIPFDERPAGHVDYERHRSARDWDISMTYDDVKNTGMRIYLYATKQTFAVDYETLLEQLTMPILLIHGRDDSIFPVRNSLDMAKRIPNAELILLDHADHIIVVNHFDKIAGPLKEFVDRVSHLQATDAAGHAV